MRAVERCVWIQALLSESGAVSGVLGMTVASDMSKFYEHIDHEKLIASARRLNYPMRLRRLNLCIYRGERRCRVGGAFSRPVYVTRSVGAGCSHAHALIKAYTAEEPRLLAERHVGANLKVVVDNVSAQFFEKQLKEARR